MATSLISRFFRFGIFVVFCLVLFGVVRAKKLRAQQELIASNEQLRIASDELCGDNADCTSYRGAFDMLVHEDGGMAAPPGKHLENRSHILIEADSYLKGHGVGVGAGPAYGPYFRFLSCVSAALWSERGDSRTLFSSENIIETYYALAGQDGASSGGIPRACSLLGAYHTRLEQTREEQSILQSASDEPDPEEVWHAVLVDEMRVRAPKRDAKASVRRDQERYCLFAMRCRMAENSPFAGK
jgi:hypothetical protein